MHDEEEMQTGIGHGDVDPAAELTHPPLTHPSNSISSHFTGGSYRGMLSVWLSSHEPISFFRCRPPLKVARTGQRLENRPPTQQVASPHFWAGGLRRNSSEN